jgi:integrase
MHQISLWNHVDSALFRSAPFKNAQSFDVRRHRIAPATESMAAFECIDPLLRSPAARALGAANTKDRNAYLIALLGGKAGLLCGEMMALEWSDVDLGKRQLRIQRSDWKGHVTATKGGRLRYVPMTLRLATALREHRHLRAARVICQRDGSPLTRRSSRTTFDGQFVRSVVCEERRTSTAAHVLFTSRHARRTGATTQRYMHLSPAAIEGAIRLLDQPKPVHGFGDMLEARQTGKSLA